MKRPAKTGLVPLNRALSKLRVASRAEATALIRAGRVSVDGRVIRDPQAPVSPERARIAIDREKATREAPLTIVLHKPRGVLTTRQDPGAGRRSTICSGRPARAWFRSAGWTWPRQASSC